MYMEQVQSWLSSPDRLLQILASWVVFYVFILALTRVSGKHTTGNMNNFDSIITVSIRSTMAAGILLNNVAMLEKFVPVRAATPGGDENDGKQPAGVDA